MEQIKKKKIYFVSIQVSLTQIVRKNEKKKKIQNVVAFEIIPSSILC